MSALIVISLSVTGFIVFGNSDTANEEDKEDENEEIIEEEDEDEERNAVDEYQDAVDEVIGDEELSEDEMINTGQSLLGRHHELYLASNEEEFEQALVDSYRYPEDVLDDLFNCCYEPETYENLDIEFTDETVFQTGVNRFEYTATIIWTIDDIETGEQYEITENFTSVISKKDKDDEFLFDNMYGERLD
ncbi:hypothetical protein [Alkalibacillus silvisoli]|uniref:Uncharacterized protein n=1 Tax=Alkalibacillus silvisoli TaxID=392823 RepID=A0ABP3K188_9BACI